MFTVLQPLLQQSCVIKSCFFIECVLLQIWTQPKFIKNIVCVVSLHNTVSIWYKKIQRQQCTHDVPHSPLTLPHTDVLHGLQSAVHFGSPVQRGLRGSIFPVRAQDTRAAPCNQRPVMCVLTKVIAHDVLVLLTLSNIQF